MSGCTKRLKSKFFFKNFFTIFCHFFKIHLTVCFVVIAASYVLIALFDFLSKTLAAFLKFTMNFCIKNLILSKQIQKFVGLYNYILLNFFQFPKKRYYCISVYIKIHNKLLIIPTHIHFSIPIKINIIKKNSCSRELMK